MSVMGRNNPESEGETVRETPVTVLPCLHGIGRFPKTRGKQSVSDHTIHNIDNSALSCDGLVLMRKALSYPIAWVPKNLGILVAFAQVLDWQTMWKQMVGSDFSPSDDYQAGLLDQKGSRGH